MHTPKFGPSARAGAMRHLSRTAIAVASTLPLLVATPEIGVDGKFAAICTVVVSLDSWRWQHYHRSGQ